MLKIISVLTLVFLAFFALWIKLPLSLPFAPPTQNLPPQNELESESYINFLKSQTGEFNPTLGEAIFHGKKFTSPSRELAEKPLPRVLGETSEEKWIEIDLSEQRLYAHEGDRIVYNFLVSTGKWAPTPTGEFRIWIKLRYTTMSGGNKADNTYYYLPNVPYTMFFYKGYGLHGTYWHNNFGQPMSHGCVNLSIPDSEKLFAWAEPTLEENKTVAYPTKDNPGTRVVIHE